MMQQTNINQAIYFVCVLYFQSFYLHYYIILLYNTCEFQSQLVDFRIPKSTS